MSRVVYNAPMPDYVVEEHLSGWSFAGSARDAHWEPLRGFDAQSEAVAHAKELKESNPYSEFRVVSNRV